MSVNAISPLNNFNFKGSETKPVKPTVKTENSKSTGVSFDATTNDATTDD